MPAPVRDPYDTSFARFIRIARGDGQAKPEVTVRPRHDEAVRGPSLFRTMLESCALERLTLPGLFIGRSEVTGVSFSGSDVHLSTLCWSNFEDCSFDGCDLTDSDLRASYFVRCSFAGADLTRCDLRHSTFRDCDFSNASLDGAFATTKQRVALALTDAQVAVVAWQDAPGPEPLGG